MKAFIASAAVAIVIAIGASMILGQVNKPVDTAFTTTSARVSHN